MKIRMLLIVLLLAIGCHSNRGNPMVPVQTDCYTEYRIGWGDDSTDCFLRVVCPSGSTEWTKCP